MNNDKEINAKELNEQISQLKKELVIYKLKKTTKQDIKPNIIKKIKYQIANILTKQTLK